MTLDEIKTEIREILAMTSALTREQVNLSKEIKDRYYTLNEKSTLVTRLHNAFSWTDKVELMNKVMSSLKTGDAIATYVDSKQ